MIDISNEIPIDFRTLMTYKDYFMAAGFTLPCTWICYIYYFLDKSLYILLLSLKKECIHLDKI